MTHQTTIPGSSRANSGPWPSSFRHIAGQWRAWAHRRAVYNRTIRELTSCSDRDLADLSIARYDIPRIAAEAAGRAGGQR